MAAVPFDADDGIPPARATRASALLVDLYELTMGQSYHAEGMDDDPATFSLFFRRLPAGWGYLVAAGLDEALAVLEGLSFAEDEIAALEATGRFTAGFLDRLRRVRFRGDVRAVPEGTPVMPAEPLLEVSGTLLEAQLAETLVLNAVHFASLVASKASRCVEMARGRALIDFSMRRTHGADAAMIVARSSFLAGFSATSNVLAGIRHGIPIAGTMAHSYVQAFDDEAAAFAAFALAYPDDAVLLVDTFDTVAGVRRAAEVGRELARRGHRLGGVRLDSGDMRALSVDARRILDEAGLAAARIVVSGNLDEAEIDRLLRLGAPVDGFGVGSRLGVVADAPYLDMAYKLVAVGGRPTLKLSTGKATTPGPRQVWRVPVDGGAADVIGRADEAGPTGGRPLLATVMRSGRRAVAETLAGARERCDAERARLGDGQRGLHARALPVTTTPALGALRDEATAEARRRNRLPG